MADCITGLDSDGFDERFLTLLRQAVNIEQSMIFAYASNDEVNCLLAANARPPRVAGRLARLYAGGLFRNDTSYRRLQRLVTRREESRDIRLTTMQTAAMSPAYRSHLFAFPDLVDKVLLAIADREGAYYPNLYRGEAAGHFTSTDPACLDALAPVLAGLIRRHYGSRRPLSRQPSPEEATVLAPLSERERQLCLHLLRGHILKSAAAELDIALSTAETYRKRPYAKLGVPSKASLVALCR